MKTPLVILVSCSECVSYPIQVIREIVVVLIIRLIVTMIPVTALVVTRTVIIDEL